MGITVGLKIGSTSLKFVELLHKKNEYKVRNLGKEDFPLSEKREGYVNYTSFIAQKIKDVIRKYNLSYKRIVTGIEGESVAVRLIRVPYMKDSELHEAIKWEAQEHLPYPLDDVALDYYVLKRNLLGAQGREMSVLLAGVRKQTIDEHLQIFQEAGLCPAIIDVNSLALYNICERIKMDKKEGTALLNIGHYITNLLILTEDYPFLVRDIKFGGHNITLSLAESLGVTYREAEEIKKARIFSERAQQLGKSVSEEEVEEIIRSSLGELINEVVRSFEYFTSNREGSPVRKVITSGGTSLVKNIDVLLSQELGISIEKMNPFANISYSKTDFRELLPSLSPAFAVPVGLALREISYV